MSTSAPGGRGRAYQALNTSSATSATSQISSHVASARQRRRTARNTATTDAERDQDPSSAEHVEHPGDDRQRGVADVVRAAIHDVVHGLHRRPRRVEPDEHEHQHGDEEQRRRVEQRSSMVRQHGRLRSSGAGARSESASSRPTVWRIRSTSGRRGRKREGIVDVDGKRGRGVRVEREAVGHAAAFEHVVAVRRGTRRQADRLLEPAGPGLVRSRCAPRSLRRRRTVSVKRHPDRLEPCPVRSSQKLATPFSISDPPKSTRRGTPRCRATGSRSGPPAPPAPCWVAQLAGDLMELARLTRGKHRQGDHDRRAPRRPPAPSAGSREHAPVAHQQHERQQGQEQDHRP